MGSRSSRRIALLQSAVQRFCMSMVLPLSFYKALFIQMLLKQILEIEYRYKFCDERIVRVQIRFVQTKKCCNKFIPICTDRMYEQFTAQMYKQLEQVATTSDRADAVAKLRTRDHCN